ncbi:50S ribosomal protein L7/L12 [Candidatus Wolfebacteria bacterium]|nr:MAG: 50S ribosomal protein L7/L12 [Candidatus Wolfebacteria bacterium]
MADEKDTTQEEQKAEAPKEEANSPAGEEAPAEAPKEEAGEDVEVPAKFKDIVEKIETMSVLDLHELVKLFEKKFGVSAAAVAVAGGGAGEAAEEKDEFTVELTSDGGAKIPVMKAVKEILALGLKEAKDIVEGAPSVLKEGVKKEEAEEMKKKIEDVGGKVELK